MSKTRRKAPQKPETENLRGNVKPFRVAQKDLVSDWLYDADMRHAINHTPSASWTDEEWRYYWRLLG